MRNLYGLGGVSIANIFVEMCQDLGLDLVFLLIYLAKTIMSCIC